MTTTARGELVEYLRTQLIGPSSGKTEEIDDPPEKRYATGVLFPVESNHDEALAEDVEDSSSGSGGQDDLDDPISLASQWMPSSLGLSFFTRDATAVVCRVWGARYERTRAEDRGKWRRVPISDQQEPETVVVSLDAGQYPAPVSVLDGRAQVHVNARSVGDGILATVTLVNVQEAPKRGAPTGHCLVQVGLQCEVTAPGEIIEYPRVEVLTADKEEEELLLLYREAHVFGIGHGCAVSWVGKERISSVQSEALPSHEVPSLVPSGPIRADVLRISRLAGPSAGYRDIISELIDFHSQYETWIDELDTQNADIPGYLNAARDRLKERLVFQSRRVREGIDLLAQDEVVREAFRLSNLAMLKQIHHSKRVAVDRHRRDTHDVGEIDYTSLDEYRWYPFQLAYLLMVLPGLAIDDHPDRQLVDLIWFPTGGGKTEAYLAVAALQIFLRRLRDPVRGGGTTVITRYTLRLLTTQQFQRAAALACAAETIRSDSPELLGSEPISIGLWVGSGASPNKYVDASAKLADLRDGAEQHGFLQLERCPWCGTELVPEDPLSEPDAIGCEATSSSFRMYCPSTGCRFHERLPVSVVDEDMYTRPPTILIGTVDKFAQLAWSERGGAFFGLRGHQAPSLIIQDELHLISGPLGTTVGMYECAIEGLLGFAGAAPKVIASTATIRRASDQVRGIFARDVALFPPAGLSASDSYFARVDYESPGRLYVGLMSGNHTASTALIQLSAALAQGPVECGFESTDLDAYWTQVIYHNSIRELGNTLMYARDDIPARVKVIAKDEARTRQLGDETVDELTSNISGDQVSGILERLSLDCGSPRALSLLVATNMIQVGIDVPRLGLMVVNGQPKTTSEYIQASSRVGRAEAKGLVVTLYAPTKPRDRSHFEGFRPYHEALYRHVEPTSVTPFALPARQRALHAAFVILIRHGVGLSGNEGARAFRADDPKVQQAIEILTARATSVDPREAAATRIHLGRLAGEWEAKAREAERAARPLYYQAGKQHMHLLKRYFTAGDGWETLDSMRSVDREAWLFILGAKASD